MNIHEAPKTINTPEQRISPFGEFKGYGPITKHDREKVIVKWTYPVKPDGSRYPLGEVPKSAITRTEYYR